MSAIEKITSFCVADGQRLVSFLEKLPSSNYTYSSPMLAGASIGQHCRHLIEFYQLLLSADKQLNYDERKRLLCLEQDKGAAIEALNLLGQALQALRCDKQLALLSTLGAEEGQGCCSETSLTRELVACLEHSIHHQALIRVVCIETASVQLLEPEFGYAPATLRYKKTLCVR